MKTLDQQRKAEDRVCEDWLLFAEDRAQTLAERREEVLHSSSAPNNGQPGAPYYVSRPTENTGLACATIRVEEAQAWVDLMKIVAEGLPTHLQVFLDLRRKTRFQRGNQGWVAYVMAHYPIEMERATGKSASVHYVSHRSTFTVWWRDIVNITARLAIRRGML